MKHPPADSFLNICGQLKGIGVGTYNEWYESDPEVCIPT
jgi:hypothetical protein